MDTQTHNDSGSTTEPPAVIPDERLAQIRNDFPILSRTVASGAPLAFLDNAASSQRPDVVIDAMDDCYRNYYANVHRGIHTLSEESTQHYEQARHSIATSINASADREVIFTAGTTSAINTVARSWGDHNVGPDDVILLTIAEHHANIVPWHQLAARTGCRIEFLPLTDSYDFDSALLESTLQRLRPRMFAFTAMSNVLGNEIPVARWVALAKQVDAAVLVDAAQLAPHDAIDVQRWEADFVVYSGHKTCGPTGIGVLYGKESLLEAMPPFLGGGGMINEVTTAGFKPAGLPEKFEAGTPPIAEAIGLEAATKYLSSVGYESIRSHQRALSARAEAGLRAMDRVRVVGPTNTVRSGIVSFHIDGVHAHDVAQQLDHHGIAVRAGHHCTMPLHHALGLTATTRASFYLYNTIEEVDRLLEAVEQVICRFAPTGRRRRRSP